MFVTAADAFGREVLIDTCVIIDVLQDRAPEAVTDLLQTRIINHSAVALAELTYLFGRLDPVHRETAATLEPIQKSLAAIPAHRLAAPSVRAFGEAGILSGIVARVRNQRPDKKLFSDALLHCQAAEQGQSILTRNIADFDLLEQLRPNQVIFYDRLESPAGPSR